MKTIGLVGGTSWPSTIDYYRFINEETNKILGGFQFARCVLYSLNYGDLHELQMRDDNEGLFSLLLDASRRVTRSGADCVLLCANTLHMFADRLEREITVPLIHIADATARAITRQGLSKVGLLGTKLTMEQDFYRAKLKQHGIETIIPGPDEREQIERTIRDELTTGIINPESKRRFLAIMQGLHLSGAQGIVLGCTEIPILIKQEDTELHVFSTTYLHSCAAVEFAVAAT